MLFVFNKYQIRSFTVNNYGGKNSGELWQITASHYVFTNFNNFYSVAYGFTIACCPSMLGRLLDCHYLVTPQLTYVWFHMASF